MEAQLGRVATPAIVIGQRVFWGFEDNKRDIAQLLGVGMDADGSESAPDAVPDAAPNAAAPNAAVSDVAGAPDAAASDPGAPS